MTPTVALQGPRPPSLQPLPGRTLATQRVRRIASDATVMAARRAAFHSELLEPHPSKPRFPVKAVTTTIRPAATPRVLRHPGDRQDPEGLGGGEWTLQLDSPPRMDTPQTFCRRYDWSFRVNIKTLNPNVARSQKNDIQESQRSHKGVPIGG